MNTDRKKYLVVLLITLGIFVVVFGLVSLLNQEKIASIDDLQRKITADLIATETQFDLLKTAPCRSISNLALSKELDELGRKLDFTQAAQGADDEDVIQLKKYYSLLQVKDYLLMEEFAAKCDININSLLYFYEAECDDCTKQGFVLTEFKRRYPDVRIYSFDTDLDFSVIETFTNLYHFGDVYPAIIVKDTSYEGLQDLNDLELIFPEVVAQKEFMEHVEEGIQYLLALDEYQDVVFEEISFLKEEKGVFEYHVTLVEGEDPEIVAITFDTELQEFMLLE